MELMNFSRNLFQYRNRAAQKCSLICLFTLVLPAGSNSHHVFLCSDDDDDDLYASFDYAMHNNTSRFLQEKTRQLQLLFGWGKNNG